MGLRLLVLVLVGCNPLARSGSSAFAPPPRGTDVRATVAGGGSAPSPAPVITRGRGKWKRIAPPGPLVDPEAMRGLAVGRELLAHHPVSGWLGSYDPCREEWEPHRAIPQPLRRVPPLALDATHAAFCCGPPDRSGVLVDVTASEPRAISSMPQTPWPGRTSQPLADGFLVPTDKRFVMRTGEWRVIAFDDAIYEATGQQGSAVASSGAHVLVWGGERFDSGSGATVLYGGGAVFDARKDAWRLVASAGAPSPRRDAAIVWTGRELFVYGGQGSAADGTRVTLTDGGRYDPATDRWQSVRGGPLLEGPVAGTVAGDTVILWDATRGAAHELRTGSWREFGLPARVPVQNRPFGHGRVAVVTDAEAFVLDPARLDWARTELPASLRGRDQRVHAMTSTHLVVWGGQRITSTGGCENVPPGQGCDPAVTTEPLHDGAALALGSCR
jgi:hypothetical protein